MAKTQKIVLACIYVLLFLLACAFSVVLSLGAQPGGISRANAFLSPIMGPWSSFLEPNALTLRMCTLSYLVVSGGLTAVLFLSVLTSYLVKNRIPANILMCVGVLSSVIWILYGIKRVCLDLM
jgi:hypothetical protein